ncbi:Gfo/Idh/MocA family protein [Gracilibacillus alcaliphilus]|uniref:Gfo/Idh/MocA family protein n=1 Tax=Gracilibacillus alcaliphilus TaxID=1401441 RepID=UPI00195EE342|nr:Gfo/Idh/MocA family oxidoreductase [Gracilibacillus alcaliphilus]MBM7677458.1 putative dehydrogenase [Gracilibacillus alcaliphilus]
MLRVAVVGLGKMGQRHADAWNRLDNTEVVALVGRDESKLSPLTSKWNAAYFPDVQSLLEKETIDVLDICLPTFLHYETITTAIQLQEGLAIVCEKPLCLTGKEAQEVEAISEQKQAKIFVGHTLRFDQEYTNLRNHVVEEAVGEVGVVRLSRKTAFPAGWFADQEKSGGIIMDLGIHDLDWLQWTFGEVERVMTRHVKKFSHYPYEYALIVLRMKSGVIAHLELSWGGDGLHTSAEIAGKGGLLVANSDNKQAIQVHKPQSSQKVGYLSADLIGEPPIVRQLRHFRDCIIGEEIPVITLHEAVQAVKVVEAAITSAQTGEVVYMRGGV